MKHITTVQPLPDHKLKLRFDDGVEGEVDFSDKAHTGVYSAWQDYNYFRRAHIGEFGELRWDQQVDFSPDTLWLRVTGRQPEELASDLQRSRTHA